MLPVWNRRKEGRTAFSHEALVVLKFCLLIVGTDVSCFETEEFFA